MLVFWTFVLRCSSDKILSYEADNNLIMFYFIKVGGSEGSTSLSSAERFDPTTKEWHPIASMSTKRAYLGVGVLNDLLYAVNSEEEIPIWEKDKYLILSFFLVGGFQYASDVFSSVECYSPKTEKRTPVSEMVSNFILYVCQISHILQILCSLVLSSHRRRRRNFRWISLRN